MMMLRNWAGIKLAVWVVSRQRAMPNQVLAQGGAFDVGNMHSF